MEDFPLVEEPRWSGTPTAELCPLGWGTWKTITALSEDS